MKALKKILRYLDPVTHLGDERNPLLLPFFVILPFTILLEYYAYVIQKDPLSIGFAAIYVYIGFIVYFSFRVGVSGGLLSVLLTIIYYFYIIFSRNYSGAEFSSGIRATIFFGIVYLLIAYVIGSLKDKIDSLIIAETNAKKRLQTIIRQLPVGIIVADASGKITEINKTAKQMFGRKVRKGRVIGQKEGYFKNPKNGKVISVNEYPIIKVLRNGRSISNKELQVNSEKGGYVLVNSSPIFDVNERLVAGVSIIQDISQLKVLEQRKDDFISMASHELKTPITSLNLIIEILRRRLRKREYTRANKMLIDAEEQTGNLLNIINNLLDVSRIKSGKIHMDPRMFELDELITETVRNLKNGIKDKNLKVVKNKKVRVFADKVRIGQVLVNFIKNAIKYSKEGGNIEVSLTSKGKEAEVSVKDHGDGIIKSEQKNIFKKLYQVRDGKKIDPKGFGMGLYISKEIIKRHKGRIWVESTPGKGATFHFTIPLRKKK